MKFTQTLLVIVLSVIASVAAVSYYNKQQTGSAPVQESAYDRVLRTKTLRCGYADWPPNVFVKDPTTGKISGIFPEVIETIAGKLDLKVEWAENTGWATFIESLRTHRIDAFCAGGWRNAQRGRYLTYTTPIFYSAVFAYVPINEHRFDGDLFAANDPKIRISGMDGEMSDIIAKKYFAKAIEVSVPQLGQISDVLVNLADHKADIAFSDPSFADGFMKSNPGKIRRLGDKPFQVFSTPISVEIHETQLRDMLDSALVELRDQGVIDEIISKYNGDPKVFLRPAKSYAE